MQDSKRDTDVKNGLLDSVGEGEGGMMFVGFSRQDYWTGLPLPPLGGLSKAGIEPKSLQADSLPFEPSGKLTQSRGCSSWGCQASDKTEQLSMQAVLREVSSCTPRPPFVSLLSSTLPTPVMGLN